jgi:hypothetical protein
LYRSVLNVLPSDRAKPGYSPLSGASRGCSLQFAKAGSAAALSQQENNNSAVVQRAEFTLLALSAQ